MSITFGRKFGKDNGKLESKSEHKTRGFENISYMLKGNSSESEVVIDETLEEILPPEPDLPKPSATKSVQLIQKLQKLDDRTIKPFVDYNEGRLFYPLLSKIGDVQDNIDFLDRLVADDILEKKVY